MSRATLSRKRKKLSLDFIEEGNLEEQRDEVINSDVSSDEETDTEAIVEDQDCEKLANLRNIIKTVTDCDLKYEYDSYLKQLPSSLPVSEKKRLAKIVGDLLSIDEVTQRLSKASTAIGANFQNSVIGEFPVLDAVSAYLGYSWRILAPPTNVCPELNCRGRLSIQKRGDVKTQVKLHTRLGTRIATKYIYR